ncbi:MAG: T9SS type B sorting domain-containing protein [Paludibacteraceae bacterium]|nr:T9SS type B sorting domain-containing protein [Paludibacteraceae bacterium]
MLKKLFIFLTLLSIHFTVQSQTWNLIWREDFGVAEDSIIKDFPDPTMTVPNHRFNECHTIDDGYYGIANSTWWSFIRSRETCPYMGWAEHFTAGGDHTGNKDGAMLIVNVGSSGNGEPIYEQTMKFDACGNHQYRFTLFGACISFTNLNILLSNLTLNIVNIKDPDHPVVVKSMDTGDLPLWKFNNSTNQNPNGIYTHAQKEWKQFDLEFTAEEGDILKLQVLNHCSSGTGNDFVLDDLSLYRLDDDEVVEPIIEMGTAIQSGSKAIIDYQVTNDVLGPWSELYDHIYFLWQRSDDDGFSWKAIPEASGLERKNVTIEKEIEESSIYRLIITGGDSPEEAQKEAEYINQHGGPSNGCAYFSISNTISALPDKYDTCGLALPIRLTLSQESICEGDDVVLSAVTENTRPLTWEYATGSDLKFNSFSHDEATGVVQPQQTTYYRAKAEWGDCPTLYSDTVFVYAEKRVKDIQLSELPSAICKGSELKITASAEIDEKINSIAWIVNKDTISTGEFTVKHSPTQATYYEFDVKGIYCPTIKKSLNVNVESNGEVWLQIDKDSICEGELAKMYVGYEETSHTIIWEKSQDGENFSEFDPKTDIKATMPTNTTYYRIKSAANSNVCPTIYSNMVRVTVEPKVSVSVAPVPTIVCEGTSVEFIAIADLTERNTFAWKKGDEILSSSRLSITDTPTERSTYQLAIQGRKCPTVTKDFVVEVEKKPQLTISLSTEGACEGDDVTLSVAQGNVKNIQWQRMFDGEEDYETFDQSIDDQKTLTAGKNVNYRLVSDGEAVCPHAISNEQRLLVEPKISFEMDSTVAICSHEKTDISVEFTGKPTDIKWSQKGIRDDDFTPMNVTGTLFSVLPDETTQYKMSYTAKYCPNGSGIITAIVDEGATLAEIPNDTICGGETVTLQTVCSNPSSIVWEAVRTDESAYRKVDQGVESLTVTPEVTTRYKLTASSENGCPTKPIYTTVVVYAPLDISVGDAQICEGDSVTLRIAGMSDYTEIIWSTAQSNFESSLGSAPTLKVSPAATTHYIVSVRNGICEDKTEGTVEVFPYPEVLSCTEYGATGYKIEAESDGRTLYYDFGEGREITTSNIIENVSFGATYHVTITNELGCKSEYTFETPIYDIHIPEYFVEGRDNWIVENLNRYPRASYKVFDRFGKLLYEGVSDDEGWDGTYNGKTQASTDYWYVINIPEIDRQFVGHFTLIRE